MYFLFSYEPNKNKYQNYRFFEKNSVNYTFEINWKDLKLVLLLWSFKIFYIIQTTWDKPPSCKVFTIKFKLTTFTSSCCLILIITFWNFTKFLYSSHSPGVKVNLIFSRKNFVYELPHNLPNNWRLRILGG